MDSLYCQQPTEGDPGPGSATVGHSSKETKNWAMVCLGWVRNDTTCLSYTASSCLQVEEVPGCIAACLPLAIHVSVSALLLTAQQQPRKYFALNKGSHRDTQRCRGSHFHLGQILLMRSIQVPPLAAMAVV